MSNQLAFIWVSVTFNSGASNITYEVALQGLPILFAQVNRVAKFSGSVSNWLDAPIICPKADRLKWRRLLSEAGLYRRGIS